MLTSASALVAISLLAADPAGPADTAQDRLVIKVGGLIQPELIMDVGDADDVFTDGFRFRRLRPMIVASWGMATLRIVPEFAGSRVRGQDVFVDLALWKNECGSLTMRVGKDKPPLSMDLGQSSTTMSFLERGPTSQLSPDRDIGVSVNFKWQAFETQVMVGNGAPDLSSNDSALSEDFEVYARVGVTAGPVYVAAAGSYGTESETGAPPEYRSSGRRPLVDDGEPNPDAESQVRKRLGGMGRVELGPVHAWVEAFLTDGRVAMGAWQGGVSVIVNGDGTNPWNRLNKPGEVEVAARVGHMAVSPFDDELEDDAKPKLYSAGISTTWSIDKYVKLIAGYELTMWDGHATPRADEHFVGLRLQALVLETP